MLKSVCIEIIRKCHLRCKHCSSSSSFSREEKIDLNEFKKLLDNMSLEQGGIVFISGGEPFLHEELPLFVKEVAQRGFSPFLYSSGTLPDNNGLKSLSKDNLEYLVSCGLEWISFSLYSLTDFHNYVTGHKDSLITLKKTIKNIYTVEGLKKEISFLPLKSTYKEIGDIVSFSEKWGISKINILKLIYQGRAKYGFFEKESLDADEEKEFMGLLEKSIKNTIEIEASKLYDFIEIDSRLLRSPFSAGVNEVFVTSDIQVLQGRRFRDLCK